MDKQQAKQDQYDYQGDRSNHVNGQGNSGQTDGGKTTGQQQNFQINIQQYFISQQNPQPASNTFDSRADLYSQSNPANVINVNSTHPQAPTGSSGPMRVSSGNNDQKKHHEKDEFQYYNNNQQNSRKGHKQSSSQQKHISHQSEIKPLKRQGIQDNLKIQGDDEKPKFNNLARAQAQAQQSRAQSQEPIQNTYNFKMVRKKSLNSDSSDNSSSDALIYKDRQYAAHNEPVSIYHQVSGEDLRKLIFFQQPDGKERFRDFKQLMVLYQNEIKKRWEERAQIKHNYRFPRMKSKRKSAPPVKQVPVQQNITESKGQNHYSPNPIKKSMIFSNRTQGDKSQVSSRDNSQIDSSLNQTSKQQQYAKVHRKIASQNMQVNQNNSKMTKSNEFQNQKQDNINKVQVQITKPKSKQKSSQRQKSSKQESRVSEQVPSSKEESNKLQVHHSRVNTQMSINEPNKFQNNLSSMKPGGITREDQNCVSAENLTKNNITNIQTGVNQKQSFHSRNVSFIQIEQKGQNLSMPINGKSMQTQVTQQTDNSAKVASMPSIAGQNPNSTKGIPKTQPIDEQKLQYHFKSMQNFMPQGSQPSLDQVNPGALSNDENYKFHQQMPSIQVDGANQFISLGQQNVPSVSLPQKVSDIEKRQNLDYAKQRLQEMVQERQSKADSKFKKVRSKGRVQQQSYYQNSKQPNKPSDSIQQSKLVGNSINDQNQDGSSQRLMNQNNNLSSVSQQQLLYHQQNATNFTNLGKGNSQNSEIWFGLGDGPSQKASYRSNHNRIIKSDQIPQNINQMKYAQKNQVIQGVGRNPTGGMPVNQGSVNVQRNFDFVPQERIRQASEQQRLSAEQSSQQVSNFQLSPDKYSVEIGKKSIVQTQKLQKGKATAFGVISKVGQGRLAKQDAIFSYSQAQFQTPEQVGLLPDQNSRTQIKNLQSSITNQSSHQMSHQLLQNNYKNNIGGLGVNRANNNSTLSSESLTQMNQYNTTGAQPAMAQQMRPAPRGMNISGVTQTRDIQRSVNVQGNGNQDNKGKSGDLSMSKSLTFNSGNSVTMGKQQSNGMTDAMLRKMQYKQHTQLNQANMEQQRALIDKLKRIQTNSKKPQKRMNGGSPIKTLVQQPQGSNEIDIQIQGDQQDNPNFIMLNEEDRKTEGSQAAEIWQENNSQEEMIYLNQNQANHDQSNPNLLQYNNQTGFNQGVQVSSQQNLIHNQNHLQYFPQVRNNNQGQNMQIQSYNPSHDQMLQQFKTMSGSYQNQQNSILVPIPSNARTNSSNHSNSSGTASKKVTFSYYNDDGNSGQISIQNANSNNPKFNQINNQQIRNNHETKKGLKGHVKASSKVDTKQSAQALAIHNHAKSMHQLEKIMNQNKQQEGYRQLGESVTQLQLQNNEMMLQQNQLNQINSFSELPDPQVGLTNYGTNQYKQQQLQTLKSNTNMTNSASALRTQGQQSNYSMHSGNNIKSQQQRKIKNSQGSSSIQVSSVPLTNQAKQGSYGGQANLVSSQKQNTKVTKQMKKSVELYKPNNMVLQQSNAFKTTQMVQDNSNGNIVTLHMNRGGAQMQQKSRQFDSNPRMKRPTSSGKHSANGGRRKRTTSNNSYSYNQQQSQNSQMKIQTYGFSEPEYSTVTDAQMRAASLLNNQGLVGGSSSKVNIGNKLTSSSSNKSVKKSQGMGVGHQYSNSYSSNGPNLGQSISNKQTVSSQQINNFNTMSGVAFGSLAKQGKRLKN